MSILIKSLTCILILHLLLVLALGGSSPPTTGSYCNLTSNQECPLLHICENHACLHKFFWPPTTREIIGTVLLFIVVGLGNAGGIGAVFLIRPILTYLLKYSPEATSQLSFSLLFGGMLGGYIFRVWKREPKTAKPVIHYEISLVSLPILMFGASTGNFLSRVFPAIVDTLIQIYFLTTSFWSMWKNFKITRAQENRVIMSPHRPPQREGEEQVEEIEITCMPPDIEQMEKEREVAENIENNQNISTRADVGEEIPNQTHIQDKVNKTTILAEIIIEEHRLFPIEKNLKLTAMMGVYTLLFLFRGTYFTESIIGVQKCNVAYWILFGVIFPLSVLFHLRFCKIIEKEHQKRLYANYQFKEKFIMTPDKLPLLRKMCFISGFLTSISGIGIGVRLISGLIKLGMQPYSSIATTGYFVLFVSITYLSVDFGSSLLTIPEIFYYMVLSFVAGFTVTFILYFCMKRHRSSINIMSLLICIFFGVLAAIFGIIYRGINNPRALLFFGDVCLL